MRCLFAALFKIPLTNLNPSVPPKDFVISIASFITTLQGTSKENRGISRNIRKYKGILNIYTSIVFDYKQLEIRICNDGGRLTRPVLRVKNNKAIITADIIKKLVKHKKEILTNLHIGIK